MSLWWIGDVCVKYVGSLWIIFFYTVRLLVPYGVLYLVMLVLLELCLGEWVTYLLVREG